MEKKPEQVELSPECKQVYDTIFNKGKKNEEGRFCLSYQKISEITGLRPEMTGSILKMLIDNKILDKKNHFNETGGLKSNSYQKTHKIPFVAVVEEKPKKEEANKKKKKNKPKFR